MTVDITVIIKMGRNKKKRTIELAVSKLDEVIYRNTRDRLRGEYYGRRDARRVGQKGNY